jgi:hypothetical protein
MKAELVPIVGQPFTITAIAVPVNVTLTCNCGWGDSGVLTNVVILGSVAAMCPGCRKTYNAFLNPQTGQVQFQVSVPQAEQVPS